jgi:hypothetical protein
MLKVRIIRPDKRLTHSSDIIKGIGISIQDGDGEGEDRFRRTLHSALVAVVAFVDRSVSAR